MKWRSLNHGTHLNLEVKKVVDLSLHVNANTPIYPGDPEPKITIATTLEHDGYNLHHVHIGSQTGSHVDAPYHFLNEGKRIDACDLRLFIGTGVVIRVPGLTEQAPITMKHVEPYLTKVQSGNIVLFETGWSQYAGEEKYFLHPYVDISVIQALLDRGVRTFCIDCINIDVTGGTAFPDHDAIAAVDGIIAENLTNFDAIDFEHPFISILPIKITGSDGAPVRAVAIQFEEE